MAGSVLNAIEAEKLRKKNAEEFAKEGTVGPDGKKIERRPEDAIPDLPENAAVREFLKKAPQNGLWLPLGKEVKVMQCFRCKAFGHRSGDRECPLNLQGNILLDAQRQVREDPMSHFVATKAQARSEKYERVAHLMKLMEQIRREERHRKRRKKREKKAKKDKNEKKRKRSDSR